MSRCVLILVSSLPHAGEPFGMAVDLKRDLLNACFDGVSRYFELVTKDACVCLHGPYTIDLHILVTA